MVFIIFTLIAVVLLIPILYIIPIGLNFKGKLLILGISYLLALVGMLANTYYQFWQTILMVLILALIVAYFLGVKLKNFAIQQEDKNAVIVRGASPLLTKNYAEENKVMPHGNEIEKHEEALENHVIENTIEENNTNSESVVDYSNDDIEVIKSEPITSEEHIKIEENEIEVEDSNVSLEIMVEDSDDEILKILENNNSSLDETASTNETVLEIDEIDNIADDTIDIEVEDHVVDTAITEHIDEEQEIPENFIPKLEIGEENQTEQLQNKETDTDEDDLIKLMSNSFEELFEDNDEKTSIKEDESQKTGAMPTIDQEIISVIEDDLLDNYLTEEFDNTEKTDIRNEEVIKEYEDSNQELEVHLNLLEDDFIDNNLIIEVNSEIPSEIEPIAESLDEIEKLVDIDGIENIEPVSIEPITMEEIVETENININEQEIIFENNIDEQDTTDMVLIEVTDEEKQSNKTKLQQQMFHTMVSQIHLSRSLMSAVEYEQQVKEYLHPSIPDQDYYTFAHLLIEHYLEEENYDELTTLLLQLKERFTNYPIIMDEILFLLDKYCQE